jgi:hypothetical protein
MNDDHVIKVGIENNNEGRSIAWVFDHPGCFAYGSEGAEAIIRVPQALIAYKNWLDGYSENSWLKNLQDFDIRLVETVECRHLNKSYEPDPDGSMEEEAWFHHDWLPLTETEVMHGLEVISWGHNDLIELTASLEDAALDRAYPNERWSIRGILRHVANAEWYYLDRLNLAGCQRDDLPENVYQRLQFTLNLNLQTLPDFVSIEEVVGRQGEFWSPRKIIRRAAWHVLDHCQHIHRLITQS